MDWEARLSELKIAQGSDLAPQRGALLKLLPKLTADPRILSLELHGSLARGEGDAGSDIDLMVEAEPDRWPEFWAERHYWAGLAGEVVLGLDHQWDAPTQEFYHAAILADRVYLDLGFRRGQIQPGPGLLWASNTWCGATTGTPWTSSRPGVACCSGPGGWSTNLST